MDLPPELILAFARLSHPKTIRSLRQTCKAWHKLINKEDQVWAEAGWRKHTRGLRACWSWATVNWHTEILLAYMRDADLDDREWTFRTEAVRRGDVAMVEILLRSGVDVHHRHDVALRTATTKGHVDLVKRLIELGADFEVQENHPLSEAARCGHAGVVKVLLGAGANVNFRDGKALRLASEYGHVDAVRELLHAGADVHASEDEPLLLACVHGHTAVINELAQAGADVHVLDDEALQLACEFDHLGSVEALFLAGADVHARGEMALKNAVTRGRIETIKLLLRKGAVIDSDLLEDAAGRGQTEVVRAFMEAKASLLDADNSGGYALVRAGTNGHLDVVQVLLDAHIYDASTLSDTLDRMARLGKMELVKLLLALDEELRLGHAMTSAAEQGHLEILRLLLSASSGRERPRRDRYSRRNSSEGMGRCLVGAAEGGHLEVVQFLLEEGVNINAKGWKGDDALICAMKAGHVEVTKALLEAGIKVRPTATDLAERIMESAKIVSAAGSHRALKHQHSRRSRSSSSGCRRDSRSRSMSEPKSGSDFTDEFIDYSDEEPIEGKR
ncbi:hypothetical protein HDV00_001963 [Rhizophlyctis rosea]|nr:hypothetical protein HDV00_001963 [Rhizophlyctis rosea]